MGILLGRLGQSFP